MRVNAAAQLHLFDGGRRPPGFYDVLGQYCARFIGDFPWLRAVMETPAEILLSFCCNGRRSTMLSTTLNNLMKHSRGLFRVLWKIDEEIAKAEAEKAAVKETEL